MTAYPLPAPAGVTVGQPGTAALWNAGFPTAANFLANRPYAILTQTIPQAIPGVGYYPIAFDSGFDNTGTAHSNTVNNSRYTCPLPGVYRVTAQVGLQPPFTGSYPYANVLLRRNQDLNQMWGSVRVYSDNTGGMGGTVQLTAAMTLRAGDYIEVEVSNQASAAITTWGGYRAARLFVHWIST